MFVHTVDHETELRILERRHAEDLFRLTELNRMYLRQWLTWPDDILSLDDSRRFIRSGLRQFADNDGFQAGIWYQGFLVGCLGFHGVDWSNRNTEIGYWLDRASTGQGIMTRCVRSMVDYIFDVWHLHRVEIRCAAGNLRSRAIPERLGFTQDGVLRDEMWLHDRFVDHVVYSTLANEWYDQRSG